MSGYGFRAYTVKLVGASKKSKAIQLNQCGMEGNEHVSVWIRRALTLLESYDPLTGPAVLAQATDEDSIPPISSYVRKPAHNEVRIKFVEHTDSPDNRIRFTINFGRTGKVSVGVEDGRTMQLGHIPTGDQYRGILYLPKAGAKGLMALESVPSAPNPARMVNNWLARAAVDLMAEDLATIATSSEGNAKGLKPQPFKLNFRQYPNIARIEKAVQHAKAAKVVLKRQAFDGGGTPKIEDLVISSSLRSAARRKTAAEIAGGLVRKATGQLADGEEAVTLNDMEKLLDAEFGGVAWTEGYIQVDDELGLKKIGFEHIDRFFVYPVGSMVQQTADEFEQSVAREIVGLQAALGLDLDLS
jgi:hypothetical protein